MAKSHLKLVTPSILNRTVTPTRLPNADLRTREISQKPKSAGRCMSAFGGKAEIPSSSLDVRY